MSDDKKFAAFEAMGGKPILEKISTVFYDKVYEDQWLGKFFAEVPQERIEAQQVDFMQGVLGGPQLYLGRMPIPAHKHMFISEELFELRQKYLNEAFAEVKAPQDLIDRWLRVDESFKAKIVKTTIEDCEKRFVTDELLTFERPYKKAA